MIKGIGVDIEDLDRFWQMDQHKIDQLAERIMTDNELAAYKILTDAHSQRLCVAKHWSVKEAVAKSFGTGIIDDVTFKNIELFNDERGCPRINLLHGLADFQTKVHISISHDKDKVIAYALCTFKWFDGVS